MVVSIAVLPFRYLGLLVPNLASLISCCCDKLTTWLKDSHFDSLRTKTDSSYWLTEWLSGQKHYILLTEKCTQWTRALIIGEITIEWSYYSLNKIFNIVLEYSNKIRLLHVHLHDNTDHNTAKHFSSSLTIMQNFDRISSVPDLSIYQNFPLLHTTIIHRVHAISLIQWRRKD